MSLADEQKVTTPIPENNDICIIDPDQERDIQYQRTSFRSLHKGDLKALNNLSSSTIVGRKRKGGCLSDSEERSSQRGRISDCSHVKQKRKGRVKPKCISYMEILPDYLILEIFQHLPKFPTLLRMREVSQRWNRLVSNSRLWTLLSFNGNEHINSANLNYLCSKIIKLNKLKKLSLAKVHGIDETSLRLIPRYECASTLESVDLSWCSGASDRSVVEFSRCPGLRELKLSHCRHVSRRSVRILAVRCPRLEILDMNCISGLRDSLLQFIGQNCPYLKVLNIANGKNISDNGLNFIANGCIHLTKLDISWCDRVSDQSISKIANNLLHLRHIGLSETKITDYSLHELSKNCIKLESIQLAKCDNISDDGMASIVERCASRLKHLNVASCDRVTDKCVQNIVEHCSELETLDVSKRLDPTLSQLLVCSMAKRDIVIYF